MIKIKPGFGAGLRIKLCDSAGMEIKITESNYLNAVLVLPNNSTLSIRDVMFDQHTNTVLVRIASGELTTAGIYKLIVNAQTQTNILMSNAAITVLEVVSTAESGYKSETLDLVIYANATPSNISISGASPFIGRDGTWMMYDDNLKGYLNTGVSSQSSCHLETYVEGDTLSVHQDSFISGDCELRFARRIKSKSGTGALTSTGKHINKRVKKWRVFDPQTSKRAVDSVSCKYAYSSQRAFPLKKSDGTALTARDIFLIIYKDVEINRDGEKSYLYIYDGNRKKSIEITGGFTTINLRNLGVVLVSNGKIIRSNVAEFGISINMKDYNVSKVTFIK